MPQYRLYFRGAAGRLRGFSEADFADDEIAIDCGRALLALSHRVEIWSEDRFVAGLDRGLADLDDADPPDAAQRSLRRFLNLRSRSRPN